VTTPSQRADADRWLSVDDIAAHLGVRRDTVYKWINRRHMPAHKVGRLWKFRKQEVDHWVRSATAQVSRLENHISDGTLCESPGQKTNQKKEM
jgi:excisionase family DNA binding protein